MQLVGGSGWQVTDIETFSYIPGYRSIPQEKKKGHEMTS